MVPLKTIVSLLTLGLVAAARPGGHVPNSGEVDAAIVHIDLHYNDKLCLELLLVDCATHVTQGDEQVCGTDGITYANHCKFTHAMCEYLHTTTHQLKIAHRGGCSTNTSLSTSSIIVGSTMPPATAIVGSTLPPATVAIGSTMPPAAVTTQVTVATTHDPIHNIVQNVFCQNVATISCGGTFEVLCGSDGQFYPNQCELSKQKCNDPSLTLADKSSCPITG